MLVAYWRLNDLSGAPFMADSGGRYDLFGTYQASGGFSPGSPVIQGDPLARSLNGAADDSGAQVPTVSQLALIGSSLSLEAWVSYSTAYAPAPPFTAPLTPLVGKLDNTTAVAGPYALYLDGNNSGRPSFAVGNGTTQVVAAADVSYTPSHLVGTLYGGVLSLYIDGKLAASAPQGGQALSDAGQPVLVGYSFRGLTAEVAVYSGALSARRVARHFALGRQVLADQAHYLTVDPPVLA